MQYNHKSQTDEIILLYLLEKHVKYTSSLRARYLLNNLSTVRCKFVKVFPIEYKRVLKNSMNKR